MITAIVVSVRTSWHIDLESCAAVVCVPPNFTQACSTPRNSPSRSPIANTFIRSLEGHLFGCPCDIHSARGSSAKIGHFSVSTHTPILSLLSISIVSFNTSPKSMRPNSKGPAERPVLGYSSVVSVLPPLSPMAVLAARFRCHSLCVQFVEYSTRFFRLSTSRIR